MPSNYQPQKGQEQALRALAILHARGISARLVLAGNSKEPYLTQLHALSKELGIEQSVAFLPFTEDPLTLYYSSNCALVCSEYEALSRVGAGSDVLRAACHRTQHRWHARNHPSRPDRLPVQRLRRLGGEHGDPRPKSGALPADGIGRLARARELFNTEDCAAKVLRLFNLW